LKAQFVLVETGLNLPKRGAHGAFVGCGHLKNDRLG